MEEKYFQKVLRGFTVEFAAGDAIRSFADKGYTVEEIRSKLDFPIPKETVGNLVWAHYLDKGIISLSEVSENSDREIVDYEKVQGEYGRIEFRQVKKTLHYSGEYIACDFGKELYKDRKGFIEKLNKLDPKDRDYILGLPWPVTTVWHKKDERIKRIIGILY
ncbi:MAG: hypothetical protein K6G75_06435 [Lachnospiraceae bacterium]|nr:hypothetical protein [Lachnospiraceae bacterium]